MEKQKSRETEKQKQMDRRRPNAFRHLDTEFSERQEEGEALKALRCRREGKGGAREAGQARQGRGIAVSWKCTGPAAESPESDALGDSQSEGAGVRIGTTFRFWFSPRSTFISTFVLLLVALAAGVLGAQPARGSDQDRLSLADCGRCRFDFSAFRRERAGLAAANLLMTLPHLEFSAANADANGEGNRAVFAAAGFVLAAQQTPQPEPPQSSSRKQAPETHSPSATSGSPGHIFWVIPAFKVDYAHGKFQPLTPKEKLQEWAQGAYDPLGFGVAAFESGVLEYSSKDGFCGYGKGFIGYTECFGSAELDSNISSFIGDYVLTVAFHQDPRYFRLGKGGFAPRLFYAISRVFVTYNDQGQTVIYSSALIGTVAAAGISNLYYPKQDRGFGLTLSRIGFDLGTTALYNGAAEFWPDIHARLHEIF
jgi:hypothetical protein